MNAAPKARVDRERVLATASELANRHGLDQLSMSELALALGIRTPSLYTHVTGLDELHRLLAIKGLRELDERLTRAALGKSTDDAIKAAAHAYRQFVHECPGVYTAMVPTPPADDAEWHQAKDQIMDTLLTVLSGSGLSEDEAIHVLRGLRSLIHGYATMELSGAFKHPVNRDDSFQRVLAIFLAGFRSDR
ncbi:MAG TPA: WHG domain-containing protein [Ktedonobacteraceae bacterium]|nr:WHG domain-containing protein [Ktedonobacteraceae bacterium]